jgi:hypothetical protein
MNKFEVKIKFPESGESKWKVLVENVEYQVDEVEINCKSYSTKDMYISAKPKSINLLTTKGITKVILK